MHNVQHQPVFTPQEEWRNEIMRGLKLLSNPTLPTIQLQQNIKTFKEAEQTLGISTNKDHFSYCSGAGSKLGETGIVLSYLTLPGEACNTYEVYQFKTESCTQWFYATNKTETGKVYLKECFECPHLDRARIER